MWGVMSEGVLCPGHAYNKQNSIKGLRSDFELIQKCCVI